MRFRRLVNVIYRFVPRANQIEAIKGEFFFFFEGHRRRPHWLANEQWRWAHASPSHHALPFLFSSSREGSQDTHEREKRECANAREGSKGPNALWASPRRTRREESRGAREEKSGQGRQEVCEADFGFDFFLFFF